MVTIRICILLRAKKKNVRELLNAENTMPNSLQMSKEFKN